MLTSTTYREFCVDAGDGGGLDRPGGGGGIPRGIVGLGEGALLVFGLEGRGGLGDPVRS